MSIRKKHKPVFKFCNITQIEKGSDSACSLRFQIAGEITGKITAFCIPWDFYRK
jgi:hypothetical protein